MHPSRNFRFCPRCGGRRTTDEGLVPFRCQACGFLYYFNPAVAVAALVLRADGRGLFIRRAKDPARGRLALVGGFVDENETLEEALRREVREEVNLELGPLRYLSSHPNVYRYAEVAYAVIDLFFTARAENEQDVQALDGVESVIWADPRAVDLEEVAFESMRDALRRHIRAQGS